MLAYVVIFVVILYLILDRSGVLADLAGTFRDQGKDGRTGHPELGEKSISDPETNRRLEIFEDFIDGLEGAEKDQDDE